MATTASATPILRPDEIEELFTVPVLERSIAGRVCDVIRTAAPRLVVPRITSVPSASWVGQLEEVALSDASFDEVVIVPSKVAGLVPISSELKEDTARDVLKLMGDRLVEHTAFRVDEALFTAQPAPAPAGIAGLAGITTVTVDDTAALLDEFVAIAATAGDRGTRIAAWIVSPGIRTKLAQIKAMTTGLSYLLNNTDNDGNRTFEGAPILSSSLIPEGTAWCIPAGRIILMLHPGVDGDVSTSEHALFSRDGWMVRSRMRVGFGCIDPTALTRISVSAP